MIKDSAFFNCNCAYALRISGWSDPESRVSLRRCLRKKRYFYAVYNYAGKADIGKGY